MNLLPIDELNSLKVIISGEFENAYREERRPDKRFICDEILELLILAYIFGHEDACDMLDIDIGYTEEEIEDSAYRKIDGKTFEERVGEYANAEDKEEDKETESKGITSVQEIMRVAETEMHRMYNEGSFKCANGVAKTKTWKTMQDEKVRDTHYFLEDVTIPMNEEFHTIDGDSAMHPGGFLSAENNVNCRCYLTYSQRRL